MAKSPKVENSSGKLVTVASRCQWPARMRSWLKKVLSFSESCPCRQRPSCPWRKSPASGRHKKPACLCRQMTAFPSTWCAAALLSSICNIVGGRTSHPSGTASTDTATSRGSRGPPTRPRPPCAGRTMSCVPKNSPSDRVLCGACLLGTAAMSFSHATICHVVQSESLSLIHI